MNFSINQKISRDPIPLFGRFTTVTLLLTLIYVSLGSIPIASASDSGQPFRAIELPGYLSYGSQHPETHSDQVYGFTSKVYTRLNRNTLIYLSTKRPQHLTSFGVKHTLYAYDIARQQSTKLYETGVDTFPFRAQVVQMVKNSNLVYVGFQGKLIATDGTERGTRILADFGELLVGSASGNLFNVFLLNETAQTSQRIFFVVLDRDTGLGRVWDNQVWQSDGTVSGTRPITPASESAYTFPFTAKHSGRTQIYFFVTEDQLVLQKASGIATSEEVHRFGTEASYVHSLVASNKGHFFCINSGRSPSSAAESGELWRLSNSGQVDKILSLSGMCRAMLGTNTGVYFQDDEGINFTNGHPGNLRRLLAGQSFDPGLRCVFDDGKNVYFTIRKTQNGTGNRLIHVQQHSSIMDLSKQAVNGAAARNIVIKSCSSEHIGLSNSDTNTETANDFYLYDLKNNSSKKINRLKINSDVSRLYPISASRDANIDTQAAILLEWMGMPFFIVPEANIGHLPALELLLDDDAE